MIFFFLFTALGDIPSGNTIEQAASIDIPPDGFISLSALIPGVVPQEVPVEDTFGEGEGLGCEYTYSISDLWVSLDVDQATIVPQDGYLTLDITIMISLNTLDDQFGLDFVVDSCGWLDSESECNGYVTTFPANAQARLDLALLDPDGDGIKELDATISNLTLDYTADAENFELECLVGSVLEALSWIGVDVYSFVLDLIGPVLETELQEELPELETSIEEAFANATLNQDLSAGETTMKLILSPEDLIILPEGLRLSFDGMTSVQETAECVLPIDPGGSAETPGVPNPVGDLEEAADIGITVQDEFVNQALYSLWKGGVLCQTIDEETFALDTSILNLLTGDAFLPLFPENKPMILNVLPQTPPTLNMDREDDIGIDITDLELNFITEVDHRRVQILSLSLDTLAGLVLNFDANSGLLAGALDIDPSNMTANIRANEFRRDDAQLITDSFGAQFGSVLDLVGLDALLGDLNFMLPSIEGLGMNQLLTAGTGSEQTDLGLYASVGPVPYVGGCNEETESGCSTTSLPSGKGMLIFMVAVLGYLRRRATETS